MVGPVIGIIMIGISIVFSIVCAMLGLIWNQIMVFEGILLGTIAGIMLKVQFQAHTVFCIVLGFIVFALVSLAQVRKVSFWAVSSILSVAWGALFAFLAYDTTHKDLIWTVFWGILGVLLTMGLHIKARRDLEA